MGFEDIREVDTPVEFLGIGECNNSSINLQDTFENDNGNMKFQSKPTMYNNHVYNVHDFEFS